jgi:para-aminobenzoate synthetase / 4-amino-4-deoxychorismate lyase
MRRRSTNISAVIEFSPPPSSDVARGVFETLLVVDGRPHELGRHLARMASSVQALYGGQLPDAAEAQAEAAARAHALARLRIEYIAGATAARAQPIDPAIVLPQEQVALTPVRVAAGFGAHKLADRSWLAQIEQLVGEGRRALLVSAEGMLLETTRANVFLLRGGALATPPLDGSILPGVTRALLLERARELPLTLADLEQADAVLLTSSVRLLEVARLRHGAELIGGLREELRRRLKIASR